MGGERAARGKGNWLTTEPFLGTKSTNDKLQIFFSEKKCLTFHYMLIFSYFPRKYG